MSEKRDEHDQRIVDFIENLGFDEFYLLGDYKLNKKFQTLVRKIAARKRLRNLPKNGQYKGNIRNMRRALVREVDALIDELGVEFKDHVLNRLFDNYLYYQVMLEKEGRAKDSEKTKQAFSDSIDELVDTYKNCGRVGRKLDVRTCMKCGDEYDHDSFIIKSNKHDEGPKSYSANVCRECWNQEEGIETVTVEAAPS